MATDTPYAFNCDDMEADFYDGTAEAERQADADARRIAVASECAYEQHSTHCPHDKCQDGRCAARAGRFGYCHGHAKATPPASAKTDYPGVFNRGSKYAARYVRGGTEYHLGTFPTAEAAAAAIREKANA